MSLGQGHGLASVKAWDPVRVLRGECIQERRQRGKVVSAGNMLQVDVHVPSKSDVHVRHSMPRWSSHLDMHAPDGRPRWAS